VTSPTDLANRALMAAGANYRIGAIDGGGKVEEMVRDVYVPARQELLRAAHWNFARKQVDMAMIADARGEFPNIMGQIETRVIRPWRFEYQYPIDCLKVRFVPQTDFFDNPTAPGLVTNGQIVQRGFVPGQIGSGGNRRRLRPARFLEANDPNYPGLFGSVTDWSQLPDLGTAIGVGYTSRTVILTNVHRAQCVYTADIEMPDQWDALFQQAFVSLLTTRLALPVALALGRDAQFALQMEARAVAATKQSVTQARIADGNEGVTSVDHLPDWMKIRFHDHHGGEGDWGDAGGDDGDDAGGVFGYGYSQLSIGNEGAF
jgi:hypothetical protein